MNNTYLRLLLLVFATILFFASCSSDDDDSIFKCWVEIDGVFQDIEPDVSPIYLNGGEDGFQVALLENLPYPAEARENSIEGTWKVNYIISKEGEVTDIEAIQDPGGGIGQASINTILTITDGISYSPGMINGLPVRIKKEVRINFKLEG